MSYLLVILNVICSVLLASKSKSNDQCSDAVAYFDGGNGVSGTVTIYQDGEFVVDLDISKLDSSPCPDKGREFQYHVHEKWTYSDYNDRYGATKCGPDYLGEHFNPYGKPSCTETKTTGYFDCEVGDMAGRYGNVQNYNGKLSSSGRIAADEYEHTDCEARLNPEAVYQRAVVFHCVDGTRLFCSPFQIKMASSSYSDNGGYNDNNYNHDNYNTKGRGDYNKNKNSDYGGTSNYDSNSNYDGNSNRDGNYDTNSNYGGTSNYGSNSNRDGNYDTNSNRGSNSNYGGNSNYGDTNYDNSNRGNSNNDRSPYGRR